MTTIFRLAFASLLSVFLVAPDVALAYGGPGSVISGIGALIAVVAAIFAAFFGFIWFPLKRLYLKMRGRKDAGKEAGANQLSQ